MTGAPHQNTQGVPSLTLGVDEFTLVLQPIDKIKITECPEISEQMITTFLQKPKLAELLGEMKHTTKVQAGYTSGLTFGNQPWHFAISWNEDIPAMGICFHFSSHTYAAFKQE